MRKYNATQKLCGWPAIEKLITEQFGEAAAKELFDHAQELYTEYAQKYGNCKGIRKTHVLSAVAAGALYLPLKEKAGSADAVQMIADAVKPLSIAKHDAIEKLPAALYMKVAHLITSRMYSEKAGYQRKWHSNTKTEKRYDLLTCPYVQTLKDMGCPEVCPAICIQDDYAFSNMKNGVIFERKKTLGRGDDCCDFCFRISGNEKHGIIRSSTLRMF